MNKQTYHRTFIVLGCVIVSLFILLSVSVRAQAADKEILITTENYRGGIAIQEALDWQSNSETAYDHLTVSIQSGTYDITEALLVYSNTTIRAASDATIRYTRKKVSGNQGRAPLISNFCSGKSGYSGAGNITIEGGIWDFQGHQGGVGYGITMEAFRFMHGSKFRVVNVTMQNIYRSHFLTIEGVEQVEVTGCVFRDYTNRTNKKEAIHIDCLHNDAMAPSNQENVIYDDTICNHISVNNCSFSNVPRGVGTHIAVAGLFPSDIVISNNTFTDITYEAIKAYHYKNAQITGNVITRAGCGIKCYLYAADSDRDEEGASNYLLALPGVTTEGTAPNLNTIIQWNVIRDVTDSKLGFGIHLAGNVDRVVKDITVSNNVITSTGAVSTKRSGIYVKYGENIRLLNNTIAKTGGAGILVVQGKTLTISQNQISFPVSNGVSVQDSSVVTLQSNAVSYAGKRGIYLKNTGNSRISTNTIKKDRTGGIGVTKNSIQVSVVKNNLLYSGKNAVSVCDSRQALVYGNTIQSPKNFGVYAYKSDSSKIKKNTLRSTKSTAVIASTSTGILVAKNVIEKTGKYGILFTSAKKSYASKNKIQRTKTYAIIYSENSKNKKQNLNYPHVSAKKGKKEIHGYTYKNMKIKVTISKKTKSTKTKKNGLFSVKVKKLKKKQKYTIQVTDKLGNSLTKERSVT